MGKKTPKRKDANSSTSSYLEQNSKNSSCSSINVSNRSIDEGSTVPDKLLVVSVESAGCSTFAERLTCGWEDLVFLHPAVMKEYNIEDLVLIKNEEKTVLCNSYALPSLRKNFIVFFNGNCPFRYQEFVSVCNFDGMVKNAEEIFVQYNEDIKECNKFLDPYILRQLYNKYIYEDMVVKWKHFDIENSCTIQRITCSLDISNLSLADNSNPDVPIFYKTTYETSIASKPYKTSLNSEMKKDAFNQIGGMEEQIERILCYLERFYKSDSLACSIYCGTLLLSGPPGTGKSLLLKAIVDSLNIYTEEITWTQLRGAYLSEGKNKLKEAFERAKDRAPSVLVLDDLNNVDNKTVLKILTQFLEILDDAKVFIIAATNNSDFDASVLQTSRRIAVTIKIQIPSLNQRLDILQKLLDSTSHNLSTEEVKKCASISHGFTGSNLLEVIIFAKMLARYKDLSDIIDSSEFFDIVNKKGPDNGRITYRELEDSLKLKKTSIVSSELTIEKVCLCDIGGISEIKEKFKELVVWPLKYPEAFKHFNVTPSRGVLMYGPPGCGKTMTAKALATESELNFIFKKASDISNKYVGESEKAVRDLFAMAKAKSPCIIFLDEIDAFLSERGSSSCSSGVDDRIVTTFLTEMDGVEELHGVIIIAATNRPDMLDNALVRNGRIDHFIYFPLPDSETRRETLKINMKNRILSADFDFEILVEKTEGYSGAEIVNLCAEAANQVLFEDPEAKSATFSLRHFEEALSNIPPKTNKDLIQFYENFNKKHCK